MWRFIALSVLSICVTHSACQECDTTIDAVDRIDCNVRPNDQSTCESVGCAWCPNVATNIAKCFLNITDNFHVILAAATHCKSLSDCQVAINCHPDIITYSPNQASCESRGCLWLGDLAISDQPRCVYYNNSILQGYTLFAGAFPMVETAAFCFSCDVCFNKVNCLPNENSNKITKKRCQREGCIWCSSTNECLFGATSALDKMAPKCTSCTDCPTQAYIKAGSASICRQKKGTFCNNRPSSPDDRRCVIIADHSKEECSYRKLAADTCISCASCDSPIIDCGTPGYYDTPFSCVEKGCLWCPNNRTEPVCRFGSSGYRCVSKDFCDIQFPRFQNIIMSPTSNQRPHLERLMEVLCYTQLGVWAPSTLDRCLSPSPYYEAPLSRDVTKMYQYYQYYYYYH